MNGLFKKTCLGSPFEGNCLRFQYGFITGHIYALADLERGILGIPGSSSGGILWACCGFSVCLFENSEWGIFFPCLNSLVALNTRPYAFICLSVLEELPQPANHILPCARSIEPNWKCAEYTCPFSDASWSPGKICVLAPRQHLSSLDGFSVEMPWTQLCPLWHWHPHCTV